MQTIGAREAADWGLLGTVRGVGVSREEALRNTPALAAAKRLSLGGVELDCASVKWLLETAQHLHSGSDPQEGGGGGDVDGPRSSSAGAGTESTAAHDHAHAMPVPVLVPALSGLLPMIMIMITP